MRAKSMAKELKGTVKEILGTAFSVGCTVAGKSPRDVQSAIDNGKNLWSLYVLPLFIFAFLLHLRVLCCHFISMSFAADGLCACVGKPRTAFTGPVIGG